MDGIKNAIRFCLASERFVLTTHDNPDADGLGAELLLSASLREQGKTVRIINSAATPALYAFMDPEDDAGFWEEGDAAFAAEAALIVLDSADAMHLGNAGERLLKTATAVFFIDHHDNAQTDPGIAWVDTAASSSSEMAVELTARLGLTLTPALATAAYAGIVYDTGFFAYPKTSARTFRSALALVEAGAEPNRVFRALRESYPAGALLLQQRVMASLELSADGKTAFLSMSRKDLADCHADYDDAENFVNWPLTCRDIEVAAFIKETPEGAYRCSLRSKGAVNVARLAQDFGGGGHRTAAGFKCRHGPKITRVELSRALEALFL